MANIRNRHRFVIDGLILLAGTIGSYWLRFEGHGATAYLRADLIYLAVSVPLRLGVFTAAGLYRVLWRYAGTHELARLTAAGLVAALFNVALGALVLPGLGAVPGRVPLSILAFDACVTLGGPALSRLVERWLEVRRQTHRAPALHEARRRRVLIAGAGEAGRLVAKEMKRDPGQLMEPVGYLDDDRAKMGGYIGGVQVLGGTEQLAEFARRTAATDLIIAMPTASGDTLRAIASAAQQLHLDTRTVPAFYELMSGRAVLSTLRKLRIEDLLRREPIETDLASVRALIRGKRVLVTGAGGSIGQELCRQIVAFEPEALGLLGHGENSIFEIQAEMQRRAPAVPTTALIADIRHRERLGAVFAQFEPQVVFHAAAHKHVPLMEDNPTEAITNNIVGTRNVAQLAADTGVERFVLISTDKAVRPTSVMGATKRVAEEVVQVMAQQRKVNFVAVRFGNVLGSRGSVVPTFLRQIAEGGPLTLTHPEVRRFFMTIPEAVQLVLQASVLGSGGEIFALDMGHAIRIVDLAHDLIRLSGLEPERDIPVVFTGLRPGEKLYEEVFENSSVHPTGHAKIFWTETPSLPVGLDRAIDTMERACDLRAESVALRQMLRALVPDYAEWGLDENGVALRAPKRPVSDATIVTAPEAPAPIGLPVVAESA